MTLLLRGQRYRFDCQLAVVIVVATNLLPAAAQNFSSAIRSDDDHPLTSQLADNQSASPQSAGPFRPLKVLRGYVSLQHPKEPVRLEPLSPKLDVWRPKSLFQIFQQKPAAASSFNEHPAPLMDRLIPEIDWNRFITDANEHNRQAAAAWEASKPQREAQARQFNSEFEERRRRMVSEWEAGQAQRESDTQRLAAESEKKLARMIAQQERGESAASNFFAMSQRLDSLIAQVHTMDQDTASRTRTEVELMARDADSEIHAARRKWHEEESSNRKSASSPDESQAEAQPANSNEPSPPPAPSARIPDTTETRANSPTRALPLSPAGSDAEMTIDPDQRLSLLWDAWYQNIDQLLREPLIEELKRHNNPAGSNRVQVTVWSDHHLEAFTVSNGPEAFDEAVLDAYRSLNGNPALAFPASSERTSVTYFAEHKHDNSSAPDAIETHEIRGDQEFTRRTR